MGLQLGEREASVSSCFLKLQPVNKGISEAFPSQAKLILKKVSLFLTCSRVQLPVPLLTVLLGRKLDLYIFSFLFSRQRSGK